MIARIKKGGGSGIFFNSRSEFPEIGIRPLLESKIILIPSRKQILDPGMDITAFLKNYLESYCLNDIFFFLLIYHSWNIFYLFMKELV